MAKISITVSCVNLLAQRLHPFQCVVSWARLGLEGGEPDLVLGPSTWRCIVFCDAVDLDKRAPRRFIACANLCMCACVCMYVCMALARIRHVRAYAYLHVNITICGIAQKVTYNSLRFYYVCVCVCARACARACVCMCMYFVQYERIYIYIYTHTHIYIYIHVWMWIWTHTSKSCLLFLASWLHPTSTCKNRNRLIHACVYMNACVYTHFKNIACIHI